MNTITCQQCGNAITQPGLVRCPRCNNLLLTPCSGNCSRCKQKTQCKE